MTIYFVNHSKREYVYAGEAEGESVTEIIAAAGWNGFNDNIIMVASVDTYRSRGYRDADNEDSSVYESESEPDSEQESDVETSDAIDAFMENLRRRDSTETLTNE